MCTKKAQTEEEWAWWPGLLGYHAENVDEQMTIFALQNDPCVFSGESGLEPEQDQIKRDKKEATALVQRRMAGI